LTGEALVCFNSEESANYAVQQQQNSPSICGAKEATGFMGDDGRAAVTFSLACRMVGLYMHLCYSFLMMMMYLLSQRRFFTTLF